MQTKTTTSCLALLLLICLCSCSKSGLKDLGIRAPNVRLPQEKLDPSFSTYNTELDRFNTSLGSSYNTTNLLNKVSLNGYKKVSYDPDLLVTLTVADGYFFDLGVKSSKRKTKDGKEYYVYSKSLEYTNTVYYRVYSRDRRLLKEIEVQNRDRKNTYSTSDFSTSKECDDYWYKNGNAVVDDLRKNLITSGFDGIKNDINQRLGYLETTTYAEFKTIKDKKHRDYKKFEANNKIVETAFKTMTSYNTEEYEERIMPAIEFWQGQYPKYRSTDEKEQFIKYACLYNITMAYYWMDDFNRAKENALKMMQESVNNKEAKKIYDMIVNMEQRCKVMGVPGQHFLTPEQKSNKGA